MINQTTAQEESEQGMPNKAVPQENIDQESERL